MSIYTKYAEIEFGDKRIGKRVVKVLEAKSTNVQMSIHAFSKTAGEAKAAYRLVSNPRFEEELLVDKSREMCLEQIVESGEMTILVPQDTTEINYSKQEHTEGLGFIGSSATLRGLIMHSAIAVTEEGIPLGILSQKIWARDPESLGKTKERKQKLIEEKESNKWLETMEAASKGCPTGVRMIHICDREGDIYPFFNKAEDLNQLFLVRNVHNRTIKDEHGETGHIIDYMETKIGRQNNPRLEVRVPRDSHTKRKERNAEMQVAFGAVRLQKSKSTRDVVRDELELYAIYAKEENVPDNCEAVSWHLLTNVPIKSFEDAVKALNWYSQRWKIERFHYALKDGCAVEKLQEDTAERMKKLIVLYSIVAMNLLNLQYLARTNPELPCTIVLDEDEWMILYKYAKRTREPPAHTPTVYEAVRMLARLGGFGGRPSDGEPGIKSLWLGYSKLSAAVEAAPYL